MERPPQPRDEEAATRPEPAERGRERGPASTMPIGGPDEAAMQLDRRLAQCRRQRTVLSLVDVVVERIVVEGDGEGDGGVGGGAATAELAREVHDEVAHRMRGRVRSTDGVLRHDERQTCAVLCGGTLDTARRVAQRYAAALNGTYRLGPGRVEVSVRIGFAAYPEDGVRAAELLQRAATRRLG